MSSYNALDQLRASGVVISSDGAEYHEIAQYDPVDATTNPSLVFAAVSKPEYSHLVDEAVAYAQAKLPAGSIEALTQLALDRSLVQVGAQILALIPGRVSLSIDPRLGYSTNDILTKSHSLISIAEELNIPRERVLIKIPATAEGIAAAHILEKGDTTHAPIHTNLTLIFSLVQALACAQAGVTVVSPFIGRVKDWWHVRSVEAGNPEGLANQPLSEHPGILLVRRIRNAYHKFGYSTQIMAAGFRKVDEIVELGWSGREGGADYMTLPPDLLEGLKNRPGLVEKALAPPHKLNDSEAPGLTGPIYYTSEGQTQEGLELFKCHSREEAISLNKVPEGLEKFSIDHVKLENRVRAMLERSHTRNQSPARPLSKLTKVGHGRGLSGDTGAPRRTVPVN
ncbi:hypothetical protein CVT24_001347 [Panaeolus cyanescens]|uniref:Transaldolase n=1 Tax=Panaeolus cyanescens TaxID=181874 RepID=A0A409YFS3_9AGAR|nr:hypothetical protein CVT24_001347 [Panaeolus cyanescens]